MKRNGGGRAIQVVAAFAVAFSAGACGSQPLPVARPQPTTVPPSTTVVSSTTIEPPDTTSTAPDRADDRPAVSEWENVTGNLAGIESYCGNLSYLSARPGTSEVFAGVVGQGMFVNDGTSDTWSPIGQGDGSAVIDHRVSSIVYDPDDPDRFWESGYFGNGPPPDPQASNANRSDDGGDTFVALAEGDSADGISVDFTDPERRTLLLGLRAQERVLRSDDGGQSWTDVSDDLPANLGEASFPYVLDAETYLLGTHKGDRSGADPAIFRTTDAGETWTKVFEEGVSGQPLVADDGNIYWVLDRGGVVGSSDRGESWTIASPVGPANDSLDARRNGLVETADGDWLSMDQVGMLLSPDRGATWLTIGDRFPWEAEAADGFAYSEEQNAVYVWRKWCQFTAGVNEVLDDAIYRFEFEPETAGADDASSADVSTSPPTTDDAPDG